MRRGTHVRRLIKSKENGRRRKKEKGKENENENENGEELR